MPVQYHLTPLEILNLLFPSAPEGLPLLRQQAQTLGIVLPSRLEEYLSHPFHRWAAAVASVSMAPWTYELGFFYDDVTAALQHVQTERAIDPDAQPIDEYIPFMELPRDHWHEISPNYLYFCNVNNGWSPYGVRVEDLSQEDPQVCCQLDQWKSAWIGLGAPCSHVMAYTLGELLTGAYSNSIWDWYESDELWDGPGSRPESLSDLLASLGWDWHCMKNVPQRETHAFLEEAGVSPDRLQPVSVTFANNDYSSVFFAWNPETQTLYTIRRHRDRAPRSGTRLRRDPSGEIIWETAPQPPYDFPHTFAVISKRL